MTCCGCSRTEPLHCFGPAMKPHYLIHYVLNGRGIFKMEGEEYPLEAGCGFLIEPGQMSFYQADEKIRGCTSGSALRASARKNMSKAWGFPRGTRCFIRSSRTSFTVLSGI